jgi:hypothetical protein
MGAGWTDVMQEFVHLFVLVIAGFIAARWRMGVIVREEFN